MKGRPETIWTARDVATLKRMWADGYSATLIARKLGGAISRNAVVGKVYRLHLPQRQTRVTIMGKAKPRPSRFKPHTLPDTAPVSKHLTLLQLTDSTCKYPDGAWNERASTFCGNETGKPPYCEFHSRLSRTPGSAWREQERERRAA